MEEVVHIFENIREIPYQIPLTIDEEDNCCSGKMMRMKKYLDTHNYTSRYRVCRFRWSDMQLPEKVLKISHEDNSTHVYIELFLDEHWINIDPTWDSGLSKIFKISNWDGANSTDIAVRSLEILDDVESQQIMENPNTEDTLEDLKINGEFYRAFNNYLEEIRTV